VKTAIFALLTLGTLGTLNFRHLTGIFNRRNQGYLYRVRDPEVDERGRLLQYPEKRYRNRYIGKMCITAIFSMRVS